MRKIEDIRKSLSANNILSSSQQFMIKGGTDTTTNEGHSRDLVQITEDDKRKERPGGGISTH